MALELSLEGQKIVVTGGATGLGFAMARSFLECGAHVALWGRTRETLETARQSLGNRSNRVDIDVVDVRDYDRVGVGFKRLIDQWGFIDGLVNNAAGNFLCASEDLSPNAFKAVTDIVLVGTFNCSRHFGSRLIETNRTGSILNIATTYTQTGSAFVLPSACAKAGVVAMTGTLAYEWATYGIRVNAIAPGPVPTEGAWQRLMPDTNFEQELKARQPLGRFGSVEDVAQLATFLMSPRSSFITGECIAVDGGERLAGGQFNFLATSRQRTELKDTFKALRSSAR